MKVRAILAASLTLAFAFAFTLALNQGTALAQAYPARGITMIIPFPPGTGNDVIGRALGAKMAESMGQPIIAENRAGASGNIAAEAASKAPADGYTIFIASSSFTLNMHLNKLPYTVGSFTGVSLLGKLPYTLVVPATFSAKSMPELVAMAKARPGALSGATGGNTTAGFFLLETLKKAAGVDIVPVAYKGTTESIADLMAERVHMLFAPMVTSLPLHRSGKLRTLAVTGSKRNSLLPDVPTFTESGFPGLDIPQWFAILTPAGTPRPIVTRLNEEIIKAMRLKDVQEQLGRLGVEPATSTPEEAEAFVKADWANWGKAVKDAGVAAP